MGGGSYGGKDVKMDGGNERWMDDEWRDGGSNGEREEWMVGQKVGGMED